MASSAQRPPPLPSASAIPSASPYPFATAPDIIRAHQKDAYFTGHLANTLTDLHRRLLGARSAHALAPELRSVASLLYFALTTLPGNRTLGEEYCDLVHVVDAPGGGVGRAAGQLPALATRAAYVAGSIILPYLVGRAMPHLRSRLRALLERRLAKLQSQGKAGSREARIWAYFSRHLTSWTSAAPFQAVTLALFYFSGTYYELTKRLLSLRYVFTRTVSETPDRAGYEVLGVLLVVQLAVQSYLHVRSTLSTLTPSSSEALYRERSAVSSAGPLNVSLNHDHSYYSNNDLLVSDLTGMGPPSSKVDIAATTHTPAAGGPRFELADDKVMGYIKGKQQRKCTLCLDEMKDPSATQCGHVFCWECIGDWVREKPECPLCRREAIVQHILPLRTM